LAEGARRTVTKAFDAPSALPSPLEAIEAERKQARAELRDRFAAAALTGLVSDPECGRFTAAVVADTAYEYADAMLKARGDE
jgi:hypothetical protein